MISAFPIILVEDRYSGTCSQGAWLAVAQADKLAGDRSWADCVLDAGAVGPHGDDLQAAAFWSDPPDWIAVGNSPEEAIDRLAAGPPAFGY